MQAAASIMPATRWATCKTYRWPIKTAGSFCTAASGSQRRICLRAASKRAWMQLRSRQTAKQLMVSVILGLHSVEGPVHAQITLPLFHGNLWLSPTSASLKAALRSSLPLSCHA
jgi:hypothetical protein